jgi:hypothetical protein
MTSSKADESNDYSTLFQECVAMWGGKQRHAGKRRVVTRGISVFFAFASVALARRGAY